MQAGFLQKNLYSTDISSKFSRFLCQISKWQGQALWKEIHILYFCLDALINFSKEISFPQDADFYKLTLADCDPKVWRTNIVGYPQRRLFFCYITLREEFWMCLAASWPPPRWMCLQKVAVEYLRRCYICKCWVAGIGPLSCSGGGGGEKWKHCILSETRLISLYISDYSFVKLNPAFQWSKRLISYEAPF